jgi:hypothetical protein
MPSRASKPPHPEKPPKRPRDINQLALALVGEAIGTAPPPKPERPKNPAAVALGALGASKGGKARRISRCGSRIRLNAGEGDLIYQAHLSQNLISGAGKVKKNVDRTLDAAEEGRLSNPQAATVIDRGRRRAGEGAARYRGDEGTPRGRELEVDRPPRRPLPTAGSDQTLPLTMLALSAAPPSSPPWSRATRSAQRSA